MPPGKRRWTSQQKNTIPPQKYATLPRRAIFHLVTEKTDTSEMGKPLTIQAYYFKNNTNIYLEEFSECVNRQNTDLFCRLMRISWCNEVLQWKCNHNWEKVKQRLKLLQRDCWKSADVKRKGGIWEICLRQNEDAWTWQPERADTSMWQMILETRRHIFFQPSSYPSV